MTTEASNRKRLPFVLEASAVTPALAEVYGADRYATELVKAITANPPTMVFRWRTAIDAQEPYGPSSASAQARALNQIHEFVRRWRHAPTDQQRMLTALLRRIDPETEPRSKNETANEKDQAAAQVQLKRLLADRYDALLDAKSAAFRFVRDIMARFHQLEQAGLQAAAMDSSHPEWQKHREVYSLLESEKVSACVRHGSEAAACGAHPGPCVMEGGQCAIRTVHK